jgi:hypothetical protein
LTFLADHDRTSAELMHRSTELVDWLCKHRLVLAPLLHPKPSKTRPLKPRSLRHLELPRYCKSPIGWLSSHIPASGTASHSRPSRNSIILLQWTLIRRVRASRRAVLYIILPSGYPQPANRLRRTIHQSEQYGLYDMTMLFDEATADGLSIGLWSNRPYGSLPRSSYTRPR